MQPNCPHCGKQHDFEEVFDALEKGGALPCQLSEREAAAVVRDQIFRDDSRAWTRHAD